MSKLVKCKECGNEVSKKADACPKCGAKRRKTSRVTWLVLILLVLIVVAGVSAPPPVQKTAAEIEATKKERVATLLSELKNIPASEFSENLTRYKELQALDPSNEKYSKKIAFYEVKEARKQRVESQFSPWNGSHRSLERLIKESMKDPDSYEHARTRFSDNGDHLVVATSYRGKNSFGAVVIGSMTAKVDLDGYILEILEK